MKVSASRESLLSPLQSVMGVVERRQTMPVLANKLLRKLAEITAMRLQLLVEAQFLAQHDQDPNDGGEKQPPQRG